MRARVEASSPVARAALEELLEIATSYGAEVNPGLWLREQDGQISVHADVPNGETLIVLPEELLVPMDRAQWEASGSNLSIVHHDEAATFTHRQSADALVAVYNATRKVEWVRTSLPKVALQDAPHVVDVIRKLRPGFASQPTSVADAFVQTRVLRSSVESTKHEGDEGRFLMPVIDLVNHHEQGAPWSRAGSALSIAVAHPTGDSECFVRYRSRQDPLDLALGYGFVDHSCTLARSVPLIVDVEGLGWVEVAGQHLQARSALDPPTVGIQPDRLWLSHITFDTRHPNRLTGVLQLAVSAYLTEQSRASAQTAAARLTDALVGALIDRNLLELEEARVNLADASGPPAISTITLAIREQQRLVRAFGSSFGGITAAIASSTPRASDGEPNLILTELELAARRKACARFRRGKWPQSELAPVDRLVTNRHRPSAWLLNHLRHGFGVNTSERSSSPADATEISNAQVAAAGCR